MTSVFVMAAGKGTRLAPWTMVVPKPVLPVANEPSVGFLLRLIARNGFRNVTANASWLADVMVNIIGDGSAYGVQLEWLIESSPLGTAGGVLAAQDRLRDKDEPIMVLSGDGLHDADLAAIEHTHRTSGAIATLALLPVSDPSQYGVAVVDDAGRITGFQEKPVSGTELSNLANTGIYVFSPKALDLCEKWGLTDFGSQLFPRLLAEGMRLQAHRLEATYWNDIGDLDQWRATNFALISGMVEAGIGPWNDDGMNDDVVLIHPSANIGKDVQITGPCVVGANAVVGDAVHLRSALVLPHAVVPEQTVVASGTIGSLTGLEAWVNDLTL